MIKNYAPRGGTVQAIELTKENFKEAEAWCGGEIRQSPLHPDILDDAWNMILLVPSVNGGLEAVVGQYLVRENNKFRVEYAREFEERYKEVGKRQDGPQFQARGSGPAYGDYPDYGFSRPRLRDPALPNAGEPNDK